MPQTVEVTLAGRLTIGTEAPDRIHSPLSDEQLVEAAETIQQSAAKIEQKNCAVCVDGRCAMCTAADVATEASVLEATDPTEFKKPPVTYQLPGGLFFAATAAAVEAEWSGLRPDTANFADAFMQVSDFLKSLGYEDGGHTSQFAYDSDSKTSCGADDGAVPAREVVVAAELADEAKRRAIDATVAAMNGKTYEQMSADEIKMQDEMRARTMALLDARFYDGYSSVEHREAVRKEYPANQQVLVEQHDATHGHAEAALVLVADLELTPDRDVLAQKGMQAFIHSKAFADQIADIMGRGSEREAQKLRFAFDRGLVVIADGKLIAPGMPVFVFKKAA